MNPFKWWREHLSMDSEATRFVLSLLSEIAIWWVYLFVIISTVVKVWNSIHPIAAIFVAVIITALTFPYMVMLSGEVIKRLMGW